MRTIQRYGWHPSPPDNRDLLYHLEDKILQGSQLPKKVDLYPNVPAIWDQGQLGSCTAHGSLRSFLTMGLKEGLTLPMLSRLEQYYNTRALEGTTGQDSGGTVRDAIKALASYGCAPESEWPYDIAEFTTKPPDNVYTDSKQHVALKYKSIRVGVGGAPMRTALASGHAIVFGFSVPSSFEDGSWDASTQVLALPDPNAGFIGGHCVAITGYDFTCIQHSRPYFVCDNSWGSSWGMQGRFMMDYEWFDRWLGLASDLWILQKVS